MLAAVGVLWFGSRTVGASLLETVRHGMLRCHVPELGPERTREVLTGFLTRGLHMTGMLLGLLFVVALAVMVAQIGFRIVPSLAAPNWERLDPVNGLGRIFSWAALLRGGTAFTKAACTGLLAALLLKGRLIRLAALDRQTLAERRRPNLGSGAASGSDDRRRLRGRRRHRFHLAARCASRWRCA